MAKGTSFNFGANRKPRAKKPRKGGSGKGRRSTSSGTRSNAWRAYISNSPIPD